jgi:hypothetical protein
MKSFKRLFSLAAIVCIGLTACQKEFTIEDGPDPIDPPTGNDSIYLDKAYFLFDPGTGLDTVLTSTVHYDNRERVILWADSTIDNPGEPYISTYQYFYNGTDTVPYKVIGLWDDLLSANDYDSTIAFFFYEAGGRKIKDSVIYHEYDGSSGSSSLEIVNYSYGTNKMYGETKNEIFTPFSSIEMRRDTATLNAAGDIVQNKSYLPVNGVYELAETMNLTFDSKISPFKYLTSYAAHKSFPYQMLELFDHVSQANILTENTSTILPNPGTFTRNSTYIYNSLQLPVKITSTVNQGTPDEESFQLILRYKKL